MNVNQIFAALLKWWWLILGATILAAASSYMAVSNQPAVYNARTVLMLGRTFENPNPSGTELNLGQQLAATYADIANMRVVREQTKEALGLDSLPGYRARPLPNSQLIEIVVTDTSPRRAQAVANELANQLIQRSPTAPQPEEQEREAFVNQQLSSLQENIEETEDQLSAARLALESAFSAREIERGEREIVVLEEKLRTLQGNYAALLANTSSGAINTLSVIEPATLPERPVSSGSMMTVIAAAAIGFVMASGTAILLDALDDTVRGTAEVRAVTDLPVLPGIPEIPDAEDPDRLVVRDEPLSPVAETFRGLHAALQTAAGENELHTLLVTSSRPHEGKSMIAANLALAMAQGGYRVLLVDADLRRPTQHKLFDVPNADGILDLLEPTLSGAGPEEVQARVQELVRPLAEEGLFLLTTGAWQEVRSGILNFRSARVILDAVTPEFDCVVIDSSPLLAVSDATVLAAQVDHVVLVAAAGSIRQRDLSEGIQRLKQAAPNILGVVLNRLDSSKHSYYNYYANYLVPEEEEGSDGVNRTNIFATNPLRDWWLRRSDGKGAFSENQ
ncbi:MAG: polysaccharide biosynthesis tyrosine autokinase [Candidatus Promineifilaceae bacterium]|nr:polysaccharide biosynthesis tyrosine autokinase [Candidatus Promineifilaceae bacterium]